MGRIAPVRLLHVADTFRTHTIMVRVLILRARRDVMVDRPTGRLFFRVKELVSRGSMRRRVLLSVPSVALVNHRRSLLLGLASRAFLLRLVFGRLPFVLVAHVAA